MKQDLENCPYCESELNKYEKDTRHCNYCLKHWDENNEIEEEESEPQDIKTYTKPESYFFNKREPNGDRISDYEL